MALTAMLGLTGVRWPIGALALTASISNELFIVPSIKDWTKERSALGRHPNRSTQADLISANPIPIYSVNFVGGAVAGLIVAMTGMVNDAPGSAAGIPGLLVMYGFNDWQTVDGHGNRGCSPSESSSGLLGSKVFKHFPIVQQHKTRSG